MNLAHKHDSPQGEVIDFPKQEQKAMSKKEDGYTPLPNFVCDEGYLAVLSGEAIKCLVLLNRQIKGFHEENKAIGESLILKLTGFKDKRTVRKAMSDLAKYNLVKITKTLGKVTSYEVTFEDRLSIELVASNDTGASKVVTSNVPRLVASNDTGTSSIKCHSVKEKKRNLKENTCTENPVDAVLKLWTPNLDSLNAWLQRSGIAKMTQSEVDGWLLEINGYYSTKLEAGLLTDTQMYTNFVKWIKRNFSSRKPAPKAQEQIDSRNVNAAWENINPDYSNAGEPVELEDWML
ncbi:replication protein [Acinetobacter baumannii]|uniref:replication protein n=1 Tax=Acinetobacter baumannii TaxID=470 RepID=UPI0038D004FE